MSDVEIRSEMAASVSRILRTSGAVVAEGDEIVILESMKMEIPVNTPASGVVRELMVKEGEFVQAGQLIAVVDAGE